jgi:hypothetical protein
MRSSGSVRTCVVNLQTSYISFCMLEFLGTLIKVLALLSMVITIINPLVFIVFSFRFIGRSRLLKGLLDQVDKHGEILDAHYNASSLYFGNYMHESYLVYPLIENVHTEVKSYRNFLVISCITER